MFPIKKMVIRSIFPIEDDHEMSQTDQIVRMPIDWIICRSNDRSLVCIACALSLYPPPLSLLMALLLRKYFFFAASLILIIILMSTG